MTNTVLLKRSSTANASPIAGNLQYGELALNYTDGNLFYKNSSNVVTVIASNKFVSVTGNITGGNASLGNLVVANYFSGDLLGRLANGNSNVSIASANGNITMSGSASQLSAVVVPANIRFRVFLQKAC